MAIAPHGDKLSYDERLPLHERSGERRYVLSDPRPSHKSSARLPLPTTPVAGKVLVMGNVTDARTPLENGEELVSLILGSRLIVLDIMGHTGFYRSGCLIAAGGATLTRGELPPEGTRCAA